MKARAFTGWHFLAVMVGGFGLIIAVNLTMAVLATRSHPGMVVESSYIAGQKFNGWLEAGRQQKALGWTVAARIDGPSIVVDARDPSGMPLTGATADIILRHPLGRGEPVMLSLVQGPGGLLITRHDLAAGQWNAEITVRHGGDRHWVRQRLTVAD